jgi:hypothetical protein
MGTKWAIEALCQTLRLECKLTRKRIDVCMLNPGFVSPRPKYDFRVFCFNLHGIVGSTHRSHAEWLGYHPAGTREQQFNRNSVNNPEAFGQSFKDAPPSYKQECVHPKS